MTIIHGTTSNQKSWPTYNITNQQPITLFAFIKICLRNSVLLSLNCHCYFWILRNPAAYPTSVYHDADPHDSQHYDYMFLMGKYWLGIIVMITMILKTVETLLLFLITRAPWTALTLANQCVEDFDLNSVYRDKVVYGLFESTCVGWCNHHETIRKNLI